MLQENCWAMASVILELLEAEGRGTYLHGKLCFPEWAPEVRERVRNRFASAFAYVSSKPAGSHRYCADGAVTAADRHPSRPESTTAVASPGN